MYAADVIGLLVFLIFIGTLVAVSIVSINHEDDEND